MSDSGAFSFREAALPSGLEALRGIENPREAGKEMPADDLNMQILWLWLRSGIILVVFSDALA